MRLPKGLLLFVALSCISAPILGADAGCLFVDGFESGDMCAWMGLCPPPVPNAAASAQIQTARDTPDGAASVAITDALVTYVKETIGSDLRGFFVQADLAGPALFVAVDPASLSPAPAPGMVASFTITEMGTSFMLREALAVTGWSSSGTGAWVPCYRQDVSNAVDLVSSLDSYESELVSLQGTIVQPFASAGTGFESAQLETAGVTGDSNLKLRVPTLVRDDADLVQGCTIDLSGSPLWRFNAQAQPSAWVLADLSVRSCPAPAVLSAVATSTTEVAIMFSRNLDPASVLADGSQFSFDNGLTAFAATAVDEVATVTTSDQAPDTTYTVTVASSVLDTLGVGVPGTPGNQASFTGFEQPAEALITELNANIDLGCDLIELTVTQGGSFEGFRLAERGTDLLTFGTLMVQTDDVIVVHIDSTDTTCNPNGAIDETTAKNEQPNSTHPQNYDTAYDWYSADTGLTSTTNVFTLYDAMGTIVDAVFVTDDPASTAAATTTETQAAIVAAAGEWEMVGGGIPAGGFVDADFNAHAAPDLDATGTDPSGDTIYRLSPTDTNTKADWDAETQSWGSTNPSW